MKIISYTFRTTMHMVYRKFFSVCLINGRNLNAALKNKFSTNNESESHLAQYIGSKIRMCGPISVAEYMKECLTNPKYGYYMHRDVFGKKGDFTTSPEISQMFGELIGVWILNDWMQAGNPDSLNIVELGPGRGTLADDVLRVFSNFNHLIKDVSLHLVEVSPKMRQMQKLKLTKSGTTRENYKETLENSDEVTSKYNIPVYWHNSLNDVPKGFSCFIAHEFFDALPIYSFQKTKNGWREVLVDVDEVNKLRFVLSNANTSSTVYIKDSEMRNQVEVCPEAGIIIQDIAQRIEDEGGSALIADYGHNGDKGDTLRGFKDHKLHDVLSEPGTADLTADVDFSYLRWMSGNKVKTYGPVTQRYFLQNMGIETRLKALMANASAQQQTDLVSGYKMLTDPIQMGERFKFFAIKQRKENNQTVSDTPAGF